MKWSLKILTDMYYQLRLAMMHDMILEKNITVSAEMHYGIIDCLERTQTDHMAELVIRAAKVRRFLG